MFNFLNYNTPYMSGSQTSRNSYRPVQRGCDPFGTFYAEPEPVYYYDPRRTVHTRRAPYYDDEYIPRQTPVRNQRTSYAPNRRPMNQSVVFEEPSLSQMFNEPRRVQRPQQRPQQQRQQPTMTKQPTQQRTGPEMPQNINTRARRTQEIPSQDPFSFFDMFSADPFLGTSRTRANKQDMAAKHDHDEDNIAGSSSHTPVENMRKGPAHTHKNSNQENDFRAANNMRRQQQQQKSQPQAKPKASTQPNKKPAKEEPVQPKVVQISSSADPKDLVTIEDETPVQQRKIEGKEPSNGLVIEEVNPQQL